MKNIFLACAMAAFAFACKSAESTQISDPAEAGAPPGACATKADCGELSKSCDAEAKAACEAAKSECSAGAVKVESECSATKPESECSESAAKVCPVSGAVEG